MYQFQFTLYALKQFKKLSNIDQTRIKRKLRFWESTKNSLQFGKRLIDFGLATHRFRIGDLRIICRYEFKKLRILVLKVGKRENIYK